MRTASLFDHRWISPTRRLFKSERIFQWQTFRSIRHGYRLWIDFRDGYWQFSSDRKVTCRRRLKSIEMSLSLSWRYDRLRSSLFPSVQTVKRQLNFENEDKVTELIVAFLIVLMLFFSLNSPRSVVIFNWIVVFIPIFFHLRTFFLISMIFANLSVRALTCWCPCFVFNRCRSSKTTWRSSSTAHGTSKSINTIRRISPISSSLYISCSSRIVRSSSFNCSIPLGFLLSICTNTTERISLISWRRIFLIAATSMVSRAFTVGLWVTRRATTRDNGLVWPVQMKFFWSSGFSSTIIAKGKCTAWAKISFSFNSQWMCWRKRWNYCPTNVSTSLVLLPTVDTSVTFLYWFSSDCVKRENIQFDEVRLPLSSDQIES